VAEEAQQRSGPGRARPPRAELDPVALRLLQAHGPKVLAIAHRYAATPDDAEDAFQRGLEILLTKAPTTDEAELLAWLKTVVKHEAFAVRRQRERATPTVDDAELAERAGTSSTAHEQAERYERLYQRAEALQRLKPQEIRALLLRAEGYSYSEICELTGWTYTKVNRSLTEGRKALAKRLAGIEAGSECERVAPLVSALVDGEASADELRVLRPHLRSCLTCRTRMREFRAGPARAAGLVPAAALAAPPSPLRAWLESGAGLLQQKIGLLGERAHAATELAAGQKVAAVAASAAVLAGGGAAADRIHEESPRPPAGTATAAAPASLPRLEPERLQPAPRAASARRPPAQATPPPAQAPDKPQPKPAPPTPATAAPAPSAPGETGEFAPGGPAAPAQSAPARRAPPPGPEFGP
jgi:RNA polymerase sigma factor (sigma-70 family)